jgi:hypothetical protein
MDSDVDLYDFGAFQDALAASAMLRVYLNSDPFGG